MRIAVRGFAVVSFLICSSASLVAQRHSGTPTAPPPAIQPVFRPQPVVPPSASARSIGIPASASSIGIPASAYAGGNRPPNPTPFVNKGGAVGPWTPVGQRGKRGYRGGYGYGFPFFPFLGYTDNSFDQETPYPPPQPAEGYDVAPVMDNGVNEQLQQLSAQLNDLQNQLNQRPAPPSDTAQGPVQPPPPTQPAQPPSPPITVVLNNGQTLRIQDYAVMGNTLWDLSSQPMKKIPTANIDIPASTKATEASGVEFPQLTGGA